MSRDIHIWYELVDGEGKVTIDIRPPYFLFGHQSTSKSFWSLPRLQEIGIEHLTILGETDPFTFYGWEMLDILRSEIELLQQHLESIDFNPELKAQWLSHLIYCYFLLVQTAPKDSIPVLSIG